MKAILFSIFIVLNLLVFIVTQYNINQRIDSSLYTHLRNLKIHYDVFMKTQQNNADVIYDMTIRDKKVIEIISKAYFTKDEALRDKLRNELVNELRESYKLIKDKGILQYHIVFPDNVTFLRMHKLHKYNDDLTNIRWDFAKVNETAKEVRGFAQGRTSHAFRNVYPIFDENKNHVGAIEFSFPSEVLQKNLNLVSQIHSHFLVKQSVFDAKAWKRDDLIFKYLPSLEHEDYLMSVTKLHEEHIDHATVSKSIKKIQGKIALNFSNEKGFSLLLRSENRVKIASFLPIKQNVTNETVAWIVSYDNDNFISVSLRDMVIIRVLSFFILAILIYFMYRIVRQKKTLNNLLKSYDKNVIFSKMDTNYLYTHVSKAFCKVSGYAQEDLIGKESIVKNSLSRSEFIDMKRSLMSGNIWKNEIQDKKKDGGFYWVDLEIEPIWKKGKVTGFISIRQDITDRKDVENIQKEIIFTMGTIGESRSRETANHVKRVA